MGLEGDDKSWRGGKQKEVGGGERCRKCYHGLRISKEKKRATQENYTSSGSLKTAGLLGVFLEYTIMD